MHAKVPESTPITEQLTSVAEHLNIKLHEQSEALVASYQGLPQKYTIAKLRASIGPVLLHFIECVTETVWTRKHRLFPSEGEDIHTKQVRQIYALCVLLLHKHSVLNATPHSSCRGNPLPWRISRLLILICWEQ